MTNTPPRKLLVTHWYWSHGYKSDDHNYIYVPFNHIFCGKSNTIFNFFINLN